MKPTSLVFLLLAVLAGCKKNDTSDPSLGLPDTSSVGKNILACKVNGQVHVYSGLPSINNADGVDYGVFTDHIGINRNSLHYKDDMRLHIAGTDSLRANVVYLFSSEAGHRAIYFKEDSIQYEYKTRDHSGWVRFSRLDKDVAAGTFEFVAYPQDSLRNDTVRVTEGRFDISQHSGTP